MKLVGITTRILIDNNGEINDSLNQRWISFFENCGLTAIIIPNNLSDPIEFIKYYNLKNFVLSGGNNFSTYLDKHNIWHHHSSYNYYLHSDLRDRTEISIIKYCSLNKLNIIGVCRGMQLLNIYFGGFISILDNHVKTTHTIIPQNNKYVPTINFNLEVNSFHNYGISKVDISPCFEILALDSSGHYVEAFHHKNYRFGGIMWHPERYLMFHKSDIILFKNLFI